MSETPTPTPTIVAPLPTLDDDCPVCGHRVLGHPRTLAPVEGIAGHYEWAFKLCTGVIVTATGTLR